MLAFCESVNQFIHLTFFYNVFFNHTNVCIVKFMQSAKVTFGSPFPDVAGLVTTDEPA